MKIKTLTRYVLFLAVLMFSMAGTASAAGQGYFGLSMGSADDEILNESSTGFKLYGGYYFTDTLAMEYGIVGLGDYGPGGIISQGGFYVGVVPSIPLNNSTSFFGKLGLFAWSIDVLDIQVDSGTDLAWGLGVETAVSDTVSLRAEYETFMDVSGGDVSLLSAGFTVLF